VKGVTSLKQLRYEEMLVYLIFFGTVFAELECEDKTKQLASFPHEITNKLASLEQQLEEKLTGLEHQLEVKLRGLEFKMDKLNSS
jgi:hypothetical protein